MAVVRQLPVNFSLLTTRPINLFALYQSTEKAALSHFKWVTNLSKVEFSGKHVD
jgi:hypothetical protein